MKKFIGSIVFVLVLMCLLCFGVSADGGSYEGPCGENLYWTYDEATETLTIGAFEGCEGEMYEWINDEDYTLLPPWRGVISKNMKALVIKDGVSKISKNSFWDCENLTEVTIGNDLKYIGDFAFDGCNSVNRVNVSNIDVWLSIEFENASSSPLHNGGALYINGNEITDLILHDGITKIGDYAFYGWYRLYSVTIPYSVTEISDNAFREIRNIYVDENNKFYSCDEYGVLFNKNKTTLLRYPDNNLRETYIIPDTVICIGKNAFNNSQNLTAISIPDSVISIDDYGFSGCGALTSLIIPDSVINIGEYAFYDCYRLEEITIGKNVISIGNNAFASCHRLGNVTLPDGIINIADSLFSFSGLKAITIPDSVTSIGSWAFYDCFLTNVIIPDGVTSIGSKAFLECRNLELAIIPDGIQYIGYYAFKDCPELKNIHYCGTAEQWETVDNREEDSTAFMNALHMATDENADELCDICGYDMAKPEHTDVYTVTETVVPTCTENGYKVYTCSCGDAYTEIIPSTGHNYQDNVCVNCGDEKASEKVDCSCDCHKGGIMGFIWKVLRFFFKIFKVNAVCDCGAAHY